jgi:hypothetical protein
MGVQGPTLGHTHIQMAPWGSGAMFVQSLLGGDYLHCLCPCTECCRTTADAAAAGPSCVSVRMHVKTLVIQQCGIVVKEAGRNWHTATHAAHARRRQVLPPSCAPLEALLTGQLSQTITSTSIDILQMQDDTCVNISLCCRHSSSAQASWLL